MVRSTNMIVPEILRSEALRKSAEVMNIWIRASGNAFRLINVPALQAAKGGDYTEPVRIKRPADLVTHSDDANPSNAATVVPITQGQGKMVRDDLKIGPASFYENEVLRGAKTPGEYSSALGELFATEAMVKIRNLLVSSAVAGIESADTTDGSTASANIHILDLTVGRTAGAKVDTTQSALNRLLYKMQDARERIVTFVMPAACYVDLVKDTIAVYQMEKVAGTTMYRDVVPAFGRNVIVADIPGLTTELTSSYYTAYTILGLGEDALTARITHWGDVKQDETITKEVDYMLVRQNLTVEFGLKGLKWAGSTNPTDAQLATAGNWDEDYEDHRDSPLIKAVVNTNAGA